MTLGAYLPKGLLPLASWALPRARGFYARQVRRAPALSASVPLQLLAHSGRHVFCGYYDLSPFAPDGSRRVCALSVARDAEPGRDAAMVGYFDLGESRPIFQRVAETRAWCWQQGARLRWLARSCASVSGADEPALLFNDVIDGSLGARLVSPADGVDREIYSVPVYAVGPQGHKFATLDFRHLQRCRDGYGYDVPGITHRGSVEAQQVLPGVGLIARSAATDFFSAHPNDITWFSREDAAAIDPRPGFDVESSYFNHLEWSPDGAHLLTFHIWHTAQGQRRVRLLLLNDAMEVAFYVPGQEHVSHYGWRNDHELLIFAQLPGDAAPGYRLLDIAAGSWTPVAPTQLLTDGHPTFRPTASNEFVTDTYPDRYNFRHLMTYDLRTETRSDLLTAYSPNTLTGPRRCDLHPRWSPDGTQVAIDSAHTGLRTIIIAEVGDQAGPLGKQA